MTYQLFSMLCIKDNLDLDETTVSSGTFIIMRIASSINSFKWPCAVETLQNAAGLTWEEAVCNTN